MSTQAQYLGGQNLWDQPQFASRPTLQLEEHSYSLEASVRLLPHQRQTSPSSLNVPAPPSRYGSYPLAAPYGTSSGFVRQSPMRTPSFNPHEVDVNLALDTSSSSFSASSHSAHASPGYNQSNLNPLELNQANYQAGQFGAGLESSHTPEGSPTSNPAVTNHSTSHSYLPAGPMQFPTALPLPPRQSELQAHYFNATCMRPQPDPLPSSKRPKTGDDYDDSQGERYDAQEQEAAKPKPSVDSAWLFSAIPAYDRPTAA